MSLMGPQDDLVHARIASMAREGKAFVGAAGNGGPHAPAGYPAAYEEVIGGNWDHANRGAYIDVAAPGVQIRTALPGDKDGVLSGTSFAAPFVAAAVAAAYKRQRAGGCGKAGRWPLGFQRPDAGAAAQQGRVEDAKPCLSTWPDACAVHMCQRSILGFEREAGTVATGAGAACGEGRTDPDSSGRLARERPAGFPPTSASLVFRFRSSYPV